MATAVAAAPAVTAAAEDDDQENDDPAAVSAAPTIVTHTGTSYELLTGFAGLNPYYAVPSQGFLLSYSRHPVTIARAVSHSWEVKTPFSRSRSASVWLPSASQASSA